MDLGEHGPLVLVTVARASNAENDAVGAAVASAPSSLLSFRLVPAITPALVVPDDKTVTRCSDFPILI